MPEPDEPPVVGTAVGVTPPEPDEPDDDPPVVLPDEPVEAAGVVMLAALEELEEDEDVVLLLKARIGLAEAVETLLLEEIEVSEVPEELAERD